MIQIAFRSLRARPAAMIVVLVVGLVGPVLLTAAGCLLTTAIVLPAPPGEFDAPVVVAGPAGFPLPDQQHQAVAYSEGSVVPSGLAQAVRADDSVLRVEDYRSPDTTRIVALGVWPRHGVDDQELAERLEGSLEGDTQVLTGDDRGLAEDPSIRASRIPLVVVGAVTSGVMLAILALVASSALALTIGERRHEVRLLRLAGATARQVRRMIIIETFVAAVLTATVGAALGRVLSGHLIEGLGNAGLLPSLMQPTGLWLTAAIGWALTILVICASASLIAGPAVRRAADDAGSTLDQHRPGPVRRQLALALGATAAAMLAATPFLGPEAGSSVGGPAILVAVGAVGLGAPILIVRGLPLLQRCTARWGLGPLGSDEIAARPGRLGSVLTLMTLGVALAVGNIGAAFTTAAADHPQIVTGSAAVEIGDASEPRTAQAIATAADAVVSPTVTSAGWIEAPYDKTGSDPLPVVGVDHAESFVKPRTSSGTLGDLVGPSIAITEHDADRLGLEVGDQVGFRFGDGAAAKLRVAAILDAGRSERARIVPYGLLAEHVRSPASTLLVHSDLSTPEIRTRLDRSDIDAHVSSGLGTSGSPFDNLGALIYLVVGLASLAFATLVAGNSIVALTLSRRPELWSWRLVGATRRQVRNALGIEAGYLAVVSTVVGVAIGAVAATSIAFGFGRLPPVPPLGLCIVPLLPAVAIVAAVLLAGARATRHAENASPETGRTV